MLTAFMVLMIVFSNAAGDIFITRGMKQIGDLSLVRPLELLRTVKKILVNLNFLMGVLCLSISFFSFLIVLSWADLSFVVPATAIVYVVTVFGAKFVLKEEINQIRWAGTLLVCLGVALVCLPDDQIITLPLLFGPLRIFLGILTAASLCYYAISIFAAEKFFSAPSAQRSGEFPPVSVLVPLRGADFLASQNYASLCRQDYPEFEIVFGVLDSRDSALPVISGLKSEFPNIPIELVVGLEKIGPNPKVNNLNNMLHKARHEILVMLDSDIRVGPDFLKTIASELPPNAQGLVTCLYRAGEAPGTVSKLEALGISSEFAPGVLVAQVAGGISFAFGAAIAISKRTMKNIGGFPAIAAYLADDYMMGNLVRKAGLPVVLSRYVVETVLSRMTMTAFMKHQIRWARGIRACAPWGHTGSVMTNGTALGLFYFAFSGFSEFGLAVLAVVVACRLVMAWIVGVRRIGDGILRRNLLLVPVRDLFSLIIWSAALFGKRVEWRGLVFRLEENGKMTPDKASE